MKRRPIYSYVFVAVLICALLLLTAAQRHKIERYNLREYRNMVVVLDTETGNLNIVNLRNDPVDGSIIPFTLIRVDCHGAIFEKDDFSEN